MAREVERVVVIDDFASPKGGATIVAMQSALALRESGLDVVYLTGHDNAEDGLRNAGIDVHCIGNSPLLERAKTDAFINGLWDRAAAREIGRWLNEYAASLSTIVHLHGLMQTLSPSVMWALGAVRDRLVIHAHDFFYVCPNGAYSDLKREAPCTLKPMSSSCWAANCDKSSYAQKVWRVARTGLARHRLRALGRVPIITLHRNMKSILVHGGLDPDQIICVQNPIKPWCDERVTAERNRGVLFVGRLSREKGAALLAQACEQLGADLTIVGEGEERAAIAAACPRARFLGWRSPAEIAVIARDARVFAAPSVMREPFGLTGFEAGLSGLPVIASANGMAAQDLQDAGFALVADPANVSALAAGIQSVLGDDGKALAMSKAGFAARNKFARTPAEFAQKLLQIYGSVLKRRAGEVGAIEMEL